MRQNYYFKKQFYNFTNRRFESVFWKIWRDCFLACLGENAVLLRNTKLQKPCTYSFSRPSCFIQEMRVILRGSIKIKILFISENTVVVLALLSDNYMESKVCQEEYNLARSLHDDPHYSTKLVQIQLSPTQHTQNSQVLIIFYMQLLSTCPVSEIRKGDVTVKSISGSSILQKRRN